VLRCCAVCALCVTGCVCGHDVEALLIIGSGVAIKRDTHAREPSGQLDVIVANSYSFALCIL
jgi:hypothetical protein